MKDGTSVTLRPIRPEDEPLMAKFHEMLSDQTVYQRYLQALKLSQRVAHERLSRLSFIDYDQQRPSSPNAAILVRVSTTLIAVEPS